MFFAFFFWEKIFAPLHVILAKMLGKVIKGILIVYIYSLSSINIRRKSVSE